MTAIVPTGADVTLVCRCRALVLTAADVAPDRASRVVCHCEGCQRFAREMDPALLDARGGTARFQVSPACLSLSGGDHLGCVQLTRGGALRWVARCCATPLGVTLARPGVPFVGLDLHRVDAAALGRPIEDVLGPLRARVNGHFARVDRRALKADTPSLLGMLSHIAPLTARWWWRGDHLRSPFFIDGVPATPVERRWHEASRPLRAGCR